ncbi:MAG: acyl-CoA reductase [Clostridia bacterium]
MSKNQQLELLCGAGALPARPLVPFADAVLSFLSDLSALLLKDGEAKGYPDVVTFAFFCRRANVERMKAEYADVSADRLGRGTVFHIAPSNVPINFAYSLAAALLAGNQSVVKASSRDFAQTRLVCRAIQALLQGAHQALAPYVNVVIYPREAQELTESLSAQCDARVIWGGDETVSRVREAALPPRAFDITFADRYSLLCVRAEEINAMDEKQLAQAAQGFYNDTYLSDQNACTSPRLVYWVCEGGAAGKSLAPAQNRFWSAMHAYASKQYAVEPVVAVDKLTAACRAGIELAGARLMPMPDNLMVRVSVETLSADIDAQRCAGGFFLEYADESLEALAPIVKRNYQTLSYIGFDPLTLRRFVRERGLFAIDRIVPVGHTMDFALTWDGYDLIRTLSRRITAL